MPVHRGEKYDWEWFGEKQRAKKHRKKERKKKYREYRYNRAIRNWYQKEPPAWRPFAHWLWVCRCPKDGW